MSSATDTFHTPGLETVLLKMDDDRRIRFESMLDSWRHDVRNLLADEPVEKTTLQKVREAVRTRVSDLESYTALEDALIIEKCQFWTAKQIAREIRRTPKSVTSRVSVLGLVMR